MLSLLLTFAAWSRPVEVAPVAPAVTDVGVQADLLGGVDAWEGGGGPGSDLRLGLAGQRSRDGRTLAGGYGGNLQVWAGPWALDHHHAWGAVRGARGPVAEAALAGSVAQGWGEARLATGVRLGGARNSGQIVLGGVVRADGQPTPGAMLLAWGTRRVHPRATVHAWAHGRVWTSDHLPATAALGIGSTWNPRLDLDVRALVSVAATAPGEQPSRAGLLPAGAAWLRTDLEVAWAVGSAFWLVGAGGWEGGRAEAGWSRWRAFAGLRATVGRTHGVSHDPGPRRVHLRVAAPDATRVEVLGDFTDWRPRPLERSEEGWILDVELAPGVYEYVYRVDGRTLAPPEATERRDDGFGGENGLLVVRPGGR